MRGEWHSSHGLAWVGLGVWLVLMALDGGRMAQLTWFGLGWLGCLAAPNGQAVRDQLLKVCSGLALWLGCLAAPNGQAVGD